MYIIHLMSASEGNSLFCFPESLKVEIRGKTKLFPEGTDIKRFVIQYSDEPKNQHSTTFIQQLYFATKIL